jgi:hypothetical protein
MTWKFILRRPTPQTMNKFGYLYINSARAARKPSAVVKFFSISLGLMPGGHGFVRKHSFSIYRDIVYPVMVVVNSGSYYVNARDA